MVIVAVAIVAGGVVVTRFLTSAIDYYCNVDEIGVRSGCDEGRRIRVQGVVVEGSLAKENGATTFDTLDKDFSMLEKPPVFVGTEARASGK